MQTFLICLAVLSTAIFLFAEVTSATINTGGYVSIPAAVRDFYSKEVLFFAQPRCRFIQFAKIKRDLQAVRGKSIVFTKYGNLSGRSKLLESDPLIPEGMTTSEVTIGVFEHAKAISVSELLLKTSMLDVLGDASKLLANHLSIDLDLEFRDVCLTTTNVVYGNGRTALNAIVNGDGLTTETVKDVIEVLETNNAPKFVRGDGEFYVCIAHPHQLRQLRDDPDWINANTYNGRVQLYKGEVGMYEGCIFISTTNMPVNTTAEVVVKYGAGFTATSGWEAVFFGENAYGWAIALDVEMRDDGVIEFGRKHALAYYGIWGSGIIEGKNIVKALTA
jgi:N4-gp56 family major capsid protein